MMSALILEHDNVGFEPVLQSFRNPAEQRTIVISRNQRSPVAWDRDGPARGRGLPVQHRDWRWRNLGFLLRFRPILGTAFRVEESVRMTLESASTLPTALSHRVQQRADAAPAFFCDRQALLRGRPVWQHVWDLLGAPLRMAILPDASSRRLGFSSLQEERLRAVFPLLHGDVLDIGAGDNALANCYGPSAIGVDVYDFGGGARIVDDTRDLPFADASFDTVTLLACLNHIPYREDCLREAHRVLRPGGRLIITMIGRWIGTVGHKIWWYSEDKERRMAPGEEWGLNNDEVLRMLAATGFHLRQQSRFLYCLNNLFIAEKPNASHCNGH